MALNFPSSPTDGQVYDDYVWSSAVSAWKKKPIFNVSAFSGTAPPASPIANELWFNTTDARFYIYYTDANSSQWIEVGEASGPTGLTGPTGPTGASGPTGPTGPGVSLGFVIALGV